jgi:hypothetical protein
MRDKAPITDKLSDYEKFNRPALCAAGRKTTSEPCRMDERMFSLSGVVLSGDSQ